MREQRSSCKDALSPHAFNRKDRENNGERATHFGGAKRLIA